MSEADHQQATERGFAQQMSLERDEKEAQMSEGIEMTKVKVRTRHNIRFSRRHYNWSSMVSCKFLLDWLHPSAFFDCLDFSLLKPKLWIGLNFFFRSVRVVDCLHFFSRVVDCWLVASETLQLIKVCYLLSSK